MPDALPPTAVDSLLAPAHPGEAFRDVVGWMAFETLAQEHLVA